MGFHLHRRIAQQHPPRWCIGENLGGPAGDHIITDKDVVIDPALSGQNDAIADPPELATTGEGSCITGMGKLGERIVMLLDTGRLVGAEGIAAEELTAA